MQLEYNSIQEECLLVNDRVTLSVSLMYTEFKYYTVLQFQQIKILTKIVIDLSNCYNFVKPSQTNSQ